MVLPLPSSPHCSPTITVAGISGSKPASELAGAGAPSASNAKEAPAEPRLRPGTGWIDISRFAPPTASADRRLPGRSVASRDGRCALQARSLTSWFAGARPLPSRTARSIAGPAGSAKRSGRRRSTGGRYLRRAVAGTSGSVREHELRHVAFERDAPARGPGARGSGRARDPVRDRRRSALASWVDEGSRSVVAAIAAATIGVVPHRPSCRWIIVRLRFGRLVKAAERHRRRRLHRRGVDPWRRPRGPPGAARSTPSPRSLADTHDRATIDRLTGVANRQALLAELFTEVERATRYERPLSVAFVDIDHFKAVNDTYGHGAGDVVLRGVAQTLAANLRASDLIGRYGGEEFMLILTETDVEEGAVLSREAPDARPAPARSQSRATRTCRSRSRSASPAASGKQLRMDTLVRDADAAMYSAKSLGRNQTYIFAEPDDDARVPRAPISAAGRARAMEIGQQARDAATDRADLRPRAAPPLPRPAVGAHRLDRRRRWPASSSCPTPRSIGSGSPRCSTTSARSRCPRRSSRSRRRSRRPSGGPSSSTRGSARSSSSRPPRSRTRCRSSCTTTSATPATATRTGCARNEIPLGARIVAIADAYDAMIHDRPYKRAMSHDAAIAELRRHAGTQFDPELVEPVLRPLREPGTGARPDRPRHDRERGQRRGSARAPCERDDRQHVIGHAGSRRQWHRRPATEATRVLGVDHDAAVAGRRLPRTSTGSRRADRPGSARAPGTSRAARSTRQCSVAC